MAGKAKKTRSALEADRLAATRTIFWTCTRCGKQWQELMPKLIGKVENTGPGHYQTFCDSCLDGLKADPVPKRDPESFYHPC